MLTRFKWSSNIFSLAVFGIPANGLKDSFNNNLNYFFNFNILNDRYPAQQSTGIFWNANVINCKANRYNCCKKAWNRPLMMLKGVDRGNGFKAVRTYQPSSRNRAMGLLHLLMRWPEFDMKIAMLPQILKLEDSFREYERIGGLLSGELKFAIRMKSIGGQLKTYLNMTIQDSTTYENLRVSILQYDQATIKWSSTMALGTSMQSGDEPTPMEVDRIWKGKGKGKDKGKNDKGKGRG